MCQRITDVVKHSSLVNTVGEKVSTQAKGGENRGSLEEISSVLLLIPEKRQGKECKLEAVEGGRES